MDYNRLAELLFPHINTTPEEDGGSLSQAQAARGRKGNSVWAQARPAHAPRQGLYGALVDERLAHQSRAYFISRIEGHRPQA